MRTIAFAAVCALALIGCEGPEGSVGPQSEQGLTVNIEALQTEVAK